MNSATYNFQQLPDYWFSIPTEYVGTASIDLVDPEETATGDCRITIDRLGNCDIRIVVTGVQPENDDERGFGQFFVEGCRQSWSDGSGIRRCRKIIVETASGTLTMGGEIRYWQSWGSGTELRVHAPKAELSVESRQSPRYWVMPLINFVSEFVHGAELEAHPLRIFQQVLANDYRADRNSVGAGPESNPLRRLIVFQTPEGPGFVEPLSDYDDQRRALEEGAVVFGRTAVMVGEVGEMAPTIETLGDWKPAQLLTVLSIACGTEVTTPWVELRDASGGLVQRFHRPLGHRTPYSRGHQAIRDVQNGALGRLLTDAFVSDQLGERYMRLALKNLLRCAPISGNLDESAGFITRLFECLNAQFGHTDINHRSSLSLDSLKFADEAIQKAKSVLLGLARKASRSNGSVEAATFNRAISGLGNLFNTGNDFGIATCKLLKQYGLHDQEVLDKHLHASSLGGFEDWASLISTLRNVKAHGDALGSPQLPFDLDEAGIIINHLHDLAIRVLLKILGFKGTYRSTIDSREAFEHRLDWVSLTTKPSDLGYR